MLGGIAHEHDFRPGRWWTGGAGEVALATFGQSMTWRWRHGGFR
jgi:hypothetical protein